MTFGVNTVIENRILKMQAVLPNCFRMFGSEFVVLENAYRNINSMFYIDAWTFTRRCTLEH